MQISIRSYLTAGTAAAVGATAIAMTPVAAGHMSLPAVQAPSVAQVTLAGFDSPISELLGTVILGSNYLFNELANPLALNTGGVPTWSFANFTGVLPAALGLPALGGYSSVGLVPQIIDDALPIISQLGYNGSNYLQAALTGFAGAGVSISEGIWNAAGDLLSFDIPGAINTLISSVSNAGTLALAAGQYVLTNVITKATAVVEFLVDEIPTLIGATVGQVSLLVGALIKPITDAIDAFGAPNPLEGAWNALVDGYLGASGLPGTILNLTIGAGVQTGPIAGLPDIAENFVPSVRTVVQGAVKGIANALATEPAAPTAAVRGAAPAAAALEVSAADVKADAGAAVEAPAAEVSAEAGDSAAGGDAPAAEVTTPKAPTRGATAGDSGTEKAPVKHRVSRKAAD